MSWRTKDTIGLPVEKQVQEELITSKGSSRFENALVSTLFGVSSALGSISKSLEVLHNKTEAIALRMETFEKEVNSPRRAGRKELEMTSPPSSHWPSMEELEAFMNLPMPTQGPGTSQDITCYETLQPFYDPLTGQELK